LNVSADHAVLMTLHAALLSAFLALLWREELRAAGRFFLRVFLSLVGGGLLVAWLLGRVGR
jgi:hypothetical protein